MKIQRSPAAYVLIALLAILPLGLRAQAPATAQWVNLFNGKDLTGWDNINTAEDTWKWRDGMLVCTGKPIGVMCSKKQYENFVLHIEWMHLEAGGNSGVFVWSAAQPNPESRLPDGVEVQMLELDWPKLNVRNGVTPPVAYVHGELFGVGEEACATREIIPRSTPNPTSNAHIPTRISFFIRRGV